MGFESRVPITNQEPCPWPWLDARNRVITKRVPCSILASQYREDSPYYLTVGGSGLNGTPIETKGWPFLDVRVEREIEIFQNWARSKSKEFLNPKTRKGKK